ncbi:MAG: shikimate kinase [Actinomycetota bacterium]|nr:shikimate kinase [Actinomycetota bacterium]
MGAQSIVLVGMMGAGKSAVGRRLARRLGRDLLDSDRQVEEMTGRTVPEIWRADGEAAFRRLESQVLADALASSTPRVIAAAGGVVLDEGNRRLLAAHHPVVWLRAPVATLVARVRRGEGRPLLSEDPAGTMARLEAERRPYYQEVADVVVDVDNDHTADWVTERLVRELGLSSPIR